MNSSRVLLAIVVGWVMLLLVLVCGGCRSSGSRFDPPPAATGRRSRGGVEIRFR